VCAPAITPCPQLRGKGRHARESDSACGLHCARGACNCGVALTKVVVIVAASAKPLAGSSAPAALERFCGQRLLDRTLALVGEAVDTRSVWVAAANPVDGVVENTVHATSTTGLFALLRELSKSVPAGSVGLAIDPRYPRLTSATLRALVSAAADGHVSAAGTSPLALAALAMPLPGPPILERPVTLVTVVDRELAEVRSRRTLVEIEREAYLERATELLAAGLLIRDPATTRIDGPLTFGVDVEIEPGCTLRGPIALGHRVRIGASCILTRVTVGDDSEIRPFTMVEDASIAERCFVGPYARVRPGTSVGPQAQIGNFVELKAAHLGRHNRINHLSFVGDATFADEVTIGAGTITCNHDGVRSQPTDIGAGAYVGSGCVLVAPLIIGEGATIGAGSTITADAPPAKLTVARTRQVVVESWRGFETKRK
jgi:acetyltransferase-like isoleucine patch superfamily enzyme